LRVLGQRVPSEALQEPLGKGLLSGHPEMPELFSAAILRYLRSIQER
jgi:hypothetical protein